MNTNTNKTQMTNFKQIQNIINKPYEDLKQCELGWLINELNKQFDIKNFWYNKNTKKITRITKYYISEKKILHICSDPSYLKKSKGCYIFENENNQTNINVMINKVDFSGIQWTKRFHHNTRNIILQQILNILKEKWEQYILDQNKKQSKLNKYFVDKYEEEETQEEKTQKKKIIFYKKKNKQNTGLKRKTIDKYYTTTKVVDQCINIIKNNLDIKNNDLIIEPSAGNGSFMNGIKSLCHNYKFFDLKPENKEIIKQDYLKYQYTKTKDINKIHVIGNPPFGRQSSLAIKFIKKSCEYCDSISFILPKSFKKESLKKHFNLYFHLIYEIDLNKNSFLVDNIPYDVPCVFQIWEKKKIKRYIPIKLKPYLFKFVKKNESPSISLRRIGVYAGKIDKNFENKSESSHYFIKFNDPVKNEINLNNSSIYKQLSNIEFNCKNYTCGPKSISKQETIKELNKILITYYNIYD